MLMGLGTLTARGDKRQGAEEAVQGVHTLSEGPERARRRQPLLGFAWGGPGAPGLAPLAQIGSSPRSPTPADPHSLGEVPRHNSLEIQIWRDRATASPGLARSQLRHRATQENRGWPGTAWAMRSPQWVTPSCHEHREHRSSLRRNSFSLQKARAPSTVRHSSRYALRQESLRQTSAAFCSATAVYYVWPFSATVLPSWFGSRWSLLPTCLKKQLAEYVLTFPGCLIFEKEKERFALERIIYWIQS